MVVSCGMAKTYVASHVDNMCHLLYDCIYLLFVIII